MFQTIQKFFEAHLAAAEQTGSAGDVEHELRLASAALLLEVMHADYATCETELGTVRDALGTAFALSAVELDELIALAQRERDAAVGLHEATRLMNESLALERKVHIIELMWRVAYADGSLDRYEEHVIRKVADLLYVPHSAFINAKLRVTQAQS